MTRRYGIASTALSAAIAALVLWHLMPRDQAESATAPKPLDAAKVRETVASVPPAPVALASVVLPPPPAPMPPPTPTPAATPTPHTTSVKGEPPPPRAVAPLKPEAKPVSPSPAMKAMHPDPEPPSAAPTTAVRPLTPEPDKPAEAKAIEPAKVVAATLEPVKVHPIKPEPVEAAPRETAPEPVAPPKAIALRPTPAVETPAEPVETTAAPEPAPPSPQVAAASAPLVGKEDAKPVIAAGRPLLRLLEHGDGPDIDIAWPATVGEREALFRAFQRCYGMLVALIAPDGRLFSDLSETAPWQINLDRYSGFVRHSGSLATPGEGDWSRRIVRHHPQASGAATVRVFPRAMDALLMGGLQRLIGATYRQTRTIRARYWRDGREVYIDDIVADGVPVAGRIALGAAADRSCGAATAMRRS